MVGRRPLWWSLAGLCAAWLLWMTLRPNQTVATDLAVLTAPAAARGLSLHLLIDIVGNIVVFIPLGATLTLALRGGLGRRLLLATGGGAALSLFIELAQMAQPSRVSSWEDWLLNVVGAFGGALATCVALRREAVCRTN